MKRRKTYFLYRIILFLVWLFYPKSHTEGEENIPDGPVIYVGNHTQMNGPIMSQLYMPKKSYCWCIGEMMEWKEVPSYAFKDFWSFKPRYTHWFFRILSYLITPLSVIIFNNANTIPVYHDARLKTTFKQTMQRLSEGSGVVIFPEYNQKYNHILYEFQDRFIDIAKFYYKDTGKCISFVPVYIAPALKKMFFGKPIVFDPETPIRKEREVICTYLKNEITSIAESLPRHRVVPYRNIPKKDYPWSKEEA